MSGWDARLPSTKLVVSDAPADGRSTRPCVRQAVARSEPRGRCAANGQITFVCSGSPRSSTAKRLSLVGRSTPVLRDEEWHRASARPVAGDIYGHLPEDLRDSVFLPRSGTSSIARTTRTPNKRGTLVISASSFRVLPPQFSRRSRHLADRRGDPRPSGRRESRPKSQPVAARRLNESM